jgi:hypothetical protein
MRLFPILLLIKLLPMTGQAQFCKITYFAQEGEKFWLIVDGEKKNEEAAANVTFTMFGITAMGSVIHHVKIIFEDEKKGSIDRSFKTNYRRNQTFMISRNKEGYHVKRTKNSLSTGLF